MKNELKTCKIHSDRLSISHTPIISQLRIYTAHNVEDYLKVNFKGHKGEFIRTLVTKVVSEKHTF